jgi:hypothetical protein
MPPAVPVLAAIGSAAVGSSAAAGMSTAALATVGGLSAASAVGGLASGIKGIVDMTKGDDGPSAQYFDQKAANRKAALQAASGARKRIAQQTQTVLTSPLGGAGRVAGGATKTLLGQ